MTSRISNPGKDFSLANQGWVLEISLSVLPNKWEWDGMSSRLAKGLEKGQNYNAEDRRESHHIKAVPGTILIYFLVLPLGLV